MQEKQFLSSPSIIFVCGGTAVGKTTLISNLIKHFHNISYIDSDALREPFLKTPDKTKPYSIDWYYLDGPVFPRNSKHYHENIGIQSYHALLELAYLSISSGHSIFIEGNYLNLIPLGYFQKVVTKFLKEKIICPKMKIIFLHAPKEVMAERIRKRNAPRDADKLASDNALNDYLNSQNLIPKELEQLEHIKIDGSQDIEKNVDLVIPYLLKSECPQSQLGLFDAQDVKKYQTS